MRQKSHLNAIVAMYVFIKKIEIRQNTAIIPMCGNRIYDDIFCNLTSH